MKIEQIAEQIKSANPSKRFAIAQNQSAIGMWDDALSRFVSIVEATITGHFVYTEGRECLVNGKQLDRNWQAI